MAEFPHNLLAIGRGIRRDAWVAATTSNAEEEISCPIPFSHFEIAIPPDEIDIYSTVRRDDMLYIEKYMVQGRDINVLHEGSPCSIRLRSLVRHIRLTRYGLLHVAVLHSSLETIKCLIDYGADVNITDGTRRSSLHLAVETGRADVVKLLIKCGIDVNIQASSGKTALMDAVHTSSHLVKLLVDAKAELNISDSKGTTALYLASGAHFPPETIRYLIEGGCDVNKGNLRGATPLMNAVGSRSLFAVELLLKSGAQVNQLDNNHWSAVFFAIESRKHFAELLRLLTSHGADINIQSKKGEYPLDLAIKYGNINAIKSLIMADCDWSYEKLKSERVEYLGDIVPSFKEWLHQEIYCTPSLLRLCRKCVRTALGPDGLPKITSLDLPHILRNYLLLQV